MNSHIRPRFRLNRLLNGLRIAELTRRRIELSCPQLTLVTGARPVSTRSPKRSRSCTSAAAHGANFLAELQKATSAVHAYRAHCSTTGCRRGQAGSLRAHGCAIPFQKRCSKSLAYFASSATVIRRPYFSLRHPQYSPYSRTLPGCARKNAAHPSTKRVKRPGDRDLSPSDCCSEGLPVEARKRFSPI